jgi:sugar phosphate isomerase/epimerase
LALEGAARAARRRPEDLFRISLAEWSFHRAIQKGELDPLDFAKKARTGFGIDAVEHVNSFFKDRVGDFGYLEQMKERAADQGVRSLLIMVDAEGELGTADKIERRTAIENHFKWIVAAAYLGCHAIRVNTYGSGPREQQQERSADSLHRLAGMGNTYGIDVIVENHGGLSSDGTWIAALMKSARHPRVGTLPDFGNFRLENGALYDRYQGVAEMMPWARAVSAKSYHFDARGEETTIDYHRMLKIVVDAGYRGYVGIEYEGDGFSEEEGVAHTKALLERVRDGLAALPR